MPYLESKQEYETFLDGEVPARLGEGGRLWTMIVCEIAGTHPFVEGARKRLVEKVAKDEVRVYNAIYLVSCGHC